MAVELEGLEFQIEAVSTEAVQGINALTASLSRLKSAVKGDGFSAVSKGIGSIGKAAEALRPEKLEGLTKALSGLSGIKISGAVSKNLAAIGTALGPLAESSEGAISRLEALPKALSAIGTVKISSTLPKRLTELGSALNTLSASPGGAELAGLASGLAGLGTARIAGSVPQRLEEIAASLDRLTPEGVSSLERVSRALRAMDGLKLPNISRAMKEVQNAEDAKKTSGSGKAGTAENDSSPGRLEQLQAALKNVSEIVAQGLPKAGAEIGKFSGGISELAAKAQGLKGAGANLLVLAKTHPAYAALGVALTAVTGAVKLLASSVKRLGSSAFAGLRKTFDALGAAARKLSAELISLSKKGISGIANGLKRAGKFVVSDFVKPFTGAIKTVKTWKNALGRIAFYRAVRSAIKMVTDGFTTGIKNLYEYSKAVGTQFTPAMNSLATSAQYLKNSLGAMAAPLVQALAPAIDFLIDKFVALLNVIGKVFAALTGKSTFSQAKKQAVEFGGAVDKAGKAVKDFTLGIDELNILNADSGSGSGGGASFGDMFEEVEVPSEIADWAAKIREAMEAGDWRSVGTILADKLNEVVDSWDAYGWGERLGGLINNGLNVAYGFLTKFDFTALGVKVGEAFTGILDTVDFDLLGRTFAAKWNALFDFLYGVVTTIPWGELGLHIAEIVNGFVDELHWDVIGQTISEGLTGIFTAAKTAIQNIHWGEIGSGLAEILNNIDWYGIIYGLLTTITAALDGLRQGIDGFLAKWDWRDMARQIYTAINDSIDTISWGDLGKSIGNGIKTALAFVTEILSEIEFNKIGQKIGEMIVGLDWVGILGGLAEMIVAGINGAIATVTGLLSKVLPHMKEWASELAKKLSECVKAIEWNDAAQALADGLSGVAEFAATFLKDFDWKGMWQKVAGFINTAIRGTDWGVVGEAFGEMLKTAIKSVTTLLREIDWAGIVRAIVNFLAGVDWIGLAGDITKCLLELIGAAAEGVIALIISLPKILKIGGEIVAGILKGIVDALLDLPGWLKAHLIDPIVNGVKDLLGIHSPSTVFAEIGRMLIEGLKQGISDTWQSILDFFGGGLENLKTFFSNAWEAIRTTAGTAWENIRTTLTGVWETLRTGAEEKFNQIKEKISTAWENVKTATADKWNSIKTTLTNVWEKVRETAQSKFEAIRKKVSDIWSNVKTDTSDKWNAIKTTLSGLWENIRETARSKFEEVRGKVLDAWKKIKEDVPGKWDEIKNAIKTKWDSIVNDAVTWGKDLCRSLSDGISAGIGWVRNAASSVASGISSYLHFSEPDVGPLSNFHTFMPDMLKLMAAGIRENAGLAENAAYDLADRVSAAINTASAGLEVPVSAYASIQTAAEYGSVYGERQGDWEPGGETSREIVSAIYDTAGQLLGALNALADRPLEVDLDGKTVTRQVEKRQRERGAGILTGGVWT